MLYFPVTRYKRVIIMAGTNDIGSDATSDEAFDSVKRLHSICHSAGVPTVAISVRILEIISRAFPSARKVIVLMISPLSHIDTCPDDTCLCLRLTI